MTVNLGSIEVTDELRRAIRARHGMAGLATRKDVRDLCHALLTADLETIASDHEAPGAEVEA